jgi:hypothetical protein
VVGIVALALGLDPGDNALAETINGILKPGSFIAVTPTAQL